MKFRLPLFAALLPVLALPFLAHPDPNPVVRENRLEGSLDWQLTRVRLDSRDGYRSPYGSNSDLLTPDRALRCQAFLSVGHDEYWDLRQFRSVSKLRDEGVDLLFFSANSVCWVSPLLPSSDGRPHRITFRGGPYGANQDYAVHRENAHGPFPHRGPDEGLLMGARNISPVNGGGDWICTRPDHWIFQGTGLKSGERKPTSASAANFRYSRHTGAAAGVFGGPLQASAYFGSFCISSMRASRCSM